MNSSAPKSNRIVPVALGLMIIVNLVLLALLGWNLVRPGGNLQIPFLPAHATVTTQPVATSTPTALPTLPPVVESSTRVPTLAANLPPQEGLRQDGALILSMSDGDHIHLFAYHPQFLPLTRLTNSTWDDTSPALSPDASLVAFSTRQNSYWDLAVLDLSTGKVTRLTDTPEYEGAPSWSPDGQWLAYETYLDGNLEIFIRPVNDPAQQPVRLTDTPAADHSPAWSPLGRSVAFVSDRSGDPEIWLASLDQVDDRFTNLSQSADTRESHPAWSPDGRYLAWVSEQGGMNTLMVWDTQHSDRPARAVGYGSWPVWSPQGSLLLTEVRGPNQTSLTAFQPSDGSLYFPLQKLPGSLYGLDWKIGRLPELLAAYPYVADASAAAPVLWSAALTVNPAPPSGRFGVVPLNDVAAPYPYLHDRVDESFNALRKAAANQAGWDILATLESAYAALTEPPSPTMQQDWLYTGRAFNLNPLPISANWMVVVREDFGGETYWRVYVKARFQDGSQGSPLTLPPWDLNARYSGSTSAYEAGGQPAVIPAGYWVDFTEIALRYSWQRLPALINWRTFFPATRFNQFVLTDGLDWNSAMAEVYPPEALATVTPTLTPTRTATPTPQKTSSDTPTPTATITETPTLNPTWTPAPPNP